MDALEYELREEFAMDQEISDAIDRQEDLDRWAEENDPAARIEREERLDEAMERRGDVRPIIDYKILPDPTCFMCKGEGAYLGMDLQSRVCLCTSAQHRWDQDHAVEYDDQDE